MIAGAYLLAAMWFSFLVGSAAGQGVKSVQDRAAHKAVFEQKFHKDLMRDLQTDPEIAESVCEESPEVPS